MMWQGLFIFLLFALSIALLAFGVRPVKRRSREQCGNCAVAPSRCAQAESGVASDAGSKQ